MATLAPPWACMRESVLIIVESFADALFQVGSNGVRHRVSSSLCVFFFVDIDSFMYNIIPKTHMNINDDDRQPPPTPFSLSRRLGRPTR